jgi:hypothetical protein
MKKNNSFLREGYLSVLWGFLAIVLCAAPSGWAVVTFDDDLEHDIDYEILGDYVQVDNATLNLLPGAYIEWFLLAYAGSTVNINPGAHIEWYLTAEAGSTVNIKGGIVGMFVYVNLGSNVTVYGKDFKIGGEPVPNGKICINNGTLTGSYENGEIFSLVIDCFFEIDGDYATVTLAAPGSSEPMPIDIDIKPGGNPNNINLKSRGVVAVAALTTNDFNAGEIDPGTVQFAGASPVRCKLCDVDGDGDDDMLFHFKTQDLELDEDSTEATLTCETFGGDKLTGTDTVRIISRFPVHKLRKAKEAKKAKTGRCEGQKPYGYYPEEEETIKRMRQLYGKKPGEGRLSCHRIAQILNKEKRPTRQGGPWQGPQVQQILKLLKLAK